MGLFSCTVPSCRTIPDEGGVKDLSIGNCNGMQGVFIPLERYGNFVAVGEMGCTEDKVYLRIDFNGIVIGYTPVTDDKGYHTDCPKVKGEL